ncbi:MAG: dienelactone hydrolase family protein [Cryobacterium sp.]|nr:dienelactone hydrolase family protein [Oligoflexia bacterium]
MLRQLRQTSLKSHFLGVTLASLATSGTSIAAPKEIHSLDNTGKNFTYREGTTDLEGYLVLPKKLTKKTPAVVLVHDWMGVGSDVKRRARMIANLGYIAFAADIYGKTTRPKNSDEAAEYATKFRGGDRALFRKRILSAIDTASKIPNVDASRIAILGYCFGGTGAMEAARLKAPVVAAISFHGGLSQGTQKEEKEITAKVIAFHGAEDPLVDANEVKGFQEEMRAAKANWEFVTYSGAVHAFTNPEVPYKQGAPFGYNAQADARSWTAMTNFLAEVFTK